MKPIFAVCVLGSVAFGFAWAQDDASKEEQKKLEGAWRLISRETDGKADPADKIKDIVMVNDGQNFVFRGSASGSGAMKGTFKVDASKKPKAMDRVPADGPRKGKTLLGIYNLEGDMLTICVSIAGKERPTTFATKENSGLLLSVFKREK